MNNNDNGFSRAQRDYDRQLPPDDEDYEREQRRREAEEEEADRVEDEYWEETIYEE